MVYTLLRQRNLVEIRSFATPNTHSQIIFFVSILFEHSVLLFFCNREEMLCYTRASCKFCHLRKFCKTHCVADSVPDKISTSGLFRVVAQTIGSTQTEFDEVMWPTKFTKYTFPHNTHAQVGILHYRNAHNVWTDQDICTRFGLAGVKVKTSATMQVRALADTYASLRVNNTNFSFTSDITFNININSIFIIINSSVSLS